MRMRPKIKQVKVMVVVVVYHQHQPLHPLETNHPYLPWSTKKMETGVMMLVVVVVVVVVALRHPLMGILVIVLLPASPTQRLSSSSFSPITTRPMSALIMMTLLL